MMQKFKKLKGLLAHRNHNPSWAEFFDLLAGIGIEKLDPRKPAKPKQAKTEQKSSEPKSTAVAAKRSVNSRYIPQSLRRQIWQRDGGECQYVDPVTKRKCQSQFALQIDH